MRDTRQWWRLIVTDDARPVSVVVHGGEIFSGFRTVESARTWAYRYIGGREVTDA